MRIFNMKIIRVLLFFSIFFVLNHALIFICSPVSNYTKNMLNDYVHEQNIDTIFCGSSLVYCGINPYKLNTVLNVNAFDLSSASQPIDTTHSLLKLALTKHPVKTVCLGAGYGAWYYHELNLIFWDKKEELRILSPYEKIKTLAVFLFDKTRFKKTDSIVFLFSWIYDRGTFTPSAIKKNIKEKLNHTFDYKDHSPMGKGYWFSAKKNDYNNITLLSQDIENGDFSASALAELDKICSLCKEKNIDFLVFAPPYTVYDTLAWGNAYFDKMRQIESFLAERGVEYYDFNFIKPDIFKSEENYFGDYQHMNAFGAEAFSTSFAKFMQLRAQGENMKKYFYTPEEFLASIDYISAVNLTLSQKNNAVFIEGTAYCGTPVTPEYQFLLKEAEEPSFTIIKDFGTEAHFSFQPKKSGKYVIRVNARKSGSKTEFDRYNEKTIMFKKRGK